MPAFNTWFPSSVHGPQTFNVKRFGAQGDSDINAISGTDDTDAIQDAVTEMQNAGGGAVTFPRGIYKIGGPIDFTENTGSFEFRGDARDASILAANFDGFVLDRAQLVSGGPWPAKISNLKIKNRHAAGGAIRLIGTDGSLIDWCDIQASTFGVQMGGTGSPASATFTATSTGTSLAVTGITGLIDNGTGDTVPLPVPISGTGVPANTLIVSQNGGYTGGNGTYITSQATTCVANTVMTNPNAPTCFTSQISNCKFTGMGTYDVVEEDSWFGVGIQMSPERMVTNCHINGWATAIRAYGAGVYIRGCQLESNTIGMKFGVDGAGNGFGANAVVLNGTTFESNVTAISILVANGGVIEGGSIQGVVNADHNSTYGVRFEGGNNITLIGIGISGEFNTACYQFDMTGGAPTEIVLINCGGSNTLAPNTVVGKDAAFNYSAVKAIRCNGFPALACTLAQLNTYAGARTLTVGDRFLINNASSALGSQTYGAAAAAGSPNALAPVWWDGTTFRYG